MYGDELRQLDFLEDRYYETRQKYYGGLDLHGNELESRNSVKVTPITGLKNDKQNMNNAQNI